MMLDKIAAIGLAALALAPLPAFAQINPSTAAVASSASAISNRSGTQGAQSRHRNTLNRQKARVTAEHARQTRAAPNK